MFPRLDHPVGDIPALRMGDDIHVHRLGGKSGVEPVVADLVDRLPGHRFEVHLRSSGDFARNYHQSGGYQGFARHPPKGVLGEHGVEYRVRDPVCDLVGVTLGNGFRGEEPAGHGGRV